MIQDSGYLLAANIISENSVAHQDDFRRLKNALQGTGAAFNWDKDEYGDPPSDTDPYTGYPDGRVALRRLQGIVLKHREALAGIDAEIAALPGSKQGQERREVNEELDRQQSEREHARQAEIAAIEI